ncbi:MAG TPA: hypothetical protein VLJ37_11045 [bacterium]|nr:hypothetical protein [bacterium]
MNLPALFPQITRVFMIPTATTYVGVEWARGRLDSYVRFGEHLAEITRVSRDSSGALEFVVDPDKVNATLIRQSRATERGSSRKLGPPYNADESRFIGRIEEIASQTVTELREPGKSQAATAGWAMMTGANIVIMGGTAIPQFLGLETKKALRSILSREAAQGIPEDFVFGADADDRLGAGVVTALRVYLGQEKLGPERTDLVPHRLHQESHTLVIGAFGIDPR